MRVVGRAAKSPTGHIFNIIENQRHVSPEFLNAG
jgi:hypothetical protein